MSWIDKIQGLLKREKKGQEKMCHYPFFNLMVTAGGHYQPCCKYNENLSDKGVELHASKNDMMEAWNSDSMAELRKAFLEGKQTKGCRQCWDEEAQGIRSMRFDGFDYNIPQSQIDKPVDPMRLDLYPSNICNLKCRICGPAYSTKWIQEAKDRLYQDEEIHLNLTDANLELVDKWLPNIKEFGLFGGEPLYMKETKTLVKKCVDKGHSKNIKLLINTNATIYSEEWANWFSQFDKVLLNFSIDDIGLRFEYQRKGSDWQKAEENMKQFVAKGGYEFEDTIECKICCTVSSYNVFYMPEYFEWLSTTFPGMPVFFNFLHEPDYVSIRNLPEEVKQIVKERLLSVGSGSYRMEKKRTRTVEDIIRFMEAPSNTPFQKFFIEVGKGDDYRGESYAEIFPEFWKHISKYQKRGVISI